MNLYSFILRTSNKLTSLMDRFQSSPKLPTTQIAELLGVSLQAVHKHLQTAYNVRCLKTGHKSYITHSIGKKLFKLKFDKNRKKIAFQIVKRGTGKTTALHNISCAASLYGAKLLLIDLDPQANLTDAFNVNSDDLPVIIDVLENQSTTEDAIINVEDGIDLIPSRIENVVLDNKLALSRAPLDRIFNNILKPIEEKYDFIFIDCPPMIGHSVTAASLYADLILAPLNPDKFSAKGLQILKAEINNLKNQYHKDIKYKVFLNKFSGNTILSDKAIHTTISLENELGNALTTAIRHSQEIPNITDLNLNIFSSLKKSISRKDFDLLTRELLNINIKPRNKTTSEQSKMTV